MAHGTHGRVSRNIGQVVDTINEAPDLPFSNVMDAEQIRQIIDDLDISFRERVFTPFVTLMVFLSQVLSPDHSCRDAVAKLIAFRVANGQEPCSPDTSSYCTGRGRLPEELFRRLVCQTGRQLHEQCPQDWLWKGRTVKIADGTTLTMPDTPDNQQVYPQPQTQKPGLGFPIARLVVLFSLGSGAALDLAIGPYKGKQTGETALLRSLFDRSLIAGDVLVGDRCYGSYCDVALIRQRGADIVVRRHQLRTTDFRQGRRLGKNDHLIIWDKPTKRPEWMDKEAFENLPDQLTLREVKVQIRQKGMRTKSLVVVTTILDPKQFTKNDIAELYHARWNVELDLRSLKCTMQMEPLRCKTPEMIRKEIWAHLLAYNMIRTIMAQAAHQYELRPRQLSFKGAMQTINAFRGYHGTDLPDSPDWHAALLEAVAYHRVADRPNRVEPRAVKRRPKPHRLLTEPRDCARKQLCESTYA
jgi:hypothetical protein